MNKKILIASLFATLMLLVPMTSVVGVISKDVTIDNHPPDIPKVAGVLRPKAEVAYAYTIWTTDPDGDDIANYTVDWGDCIVDVIEGPFASGEEISVSHTWYTKGWHLFRCKADDIYGAESDWLEINIWVRNGKVSSDSQSQEQSSQQSANSLLIRLFEQFPNAFPILRHLLRL